MSEKKAKILYNIVKYAIICLLAFLTILIIAQTVIINTKSNQIENLQQTLASTQQQTNEINNKYENITNNYDSFCEEELRKEGYAKTGEEVFK